MIISKGCAVNYFTPENDKDVVILNELYESIKDKSGLIKKLYEGTFGVILEIISD